MKLLNHFAALVFFTFSVLSLQAQDKKATVLTIEGENITLEEFENIFRKNNRDSVITKAALDEYMELFINFKLKVKEAKKLGLDTVAKFKTELDGYRITLSRPYLTDGDMLNGMISEAYERMKSEVRASHILIKLDPNATPEDTLKAYNRALDVRAKLLSGEDFATLAKKTSDDPSAKDNGGDLGYFTAFQMVYQFEDAAYATAVGEVTMPVRTRYGYHILKVFDKRAARGEVQVAHIMIKEKKEDGGAEKAKVRAEEIYQKAISGENFAELAAKYSEDGSSAKSGGELPWFGTNKMVNEFEDAAFGLKKDGDISAPIKTSYGWHIIKRLGARSIGSFADMEKEIKNKVSKDGRAEKTKASFLKKLKKQYNFTFDDKVLEEIALKADTNIFNGKWNLSKKDLQKTLFSFDGKVYKVEYLHSLLSKRDKMKVKMTPKEYVIYEGKLSGDNQIMRHEDSKLEEKHTAFRLLMNEYREGILLFELTDQKVWSKAVKDSVGLQKFFDENQSKFMWPKRRDAVIYTCANEEMAKEVRRLIESGKSNAEIVEQINKNSQLNLQIEEGVFSEEDKDVLANTAWAPGLSQNIPYNGQVVIVNVKAVVPESPKKLSETRGIVTSEYQNYLEKKWIEELRAKYKYQVKKDVLYSVK
ncbi:MAG: peptidylprolyl isomerase [Flavobacteriales bacterium]